MSLIALSCNAGITVTDGVPKCVGDWVLIQLPEVFDISQLDPVALGQLFSVGFGLMASIMVPAICVKALLKFIKNS